MGKIGLYWFCFFLEFIIILWYYIIYVREDVGFFGWGVMGYGWGIM